MAKTKKKTAKKLPPLKTAQTVKPAKAVKIPVKKTKEKKEKTDTFKSSQSQKVSEKLKLSESYVSLILGAVVVIAFSVILLIFIKESRRPVNQPKDLDASISPVLSKTPQKTYTIQDGETLWDVAVKFYGDGYRYVDIIAANKLDNPDSVPPGTVIIVPNAK